MRIADDDPSRPWTDEGVFRVAAGVYRIPLPMPNDFLRAVNVYAIQQGEAFGLIDSGVAVAESRERLEKAISVLGCGLVDVQRFLVTHIHYDHYSQALALQREFGTRVSLGRGEEPSVEALVDPSHDHLVKRFALLRRYGASDVVDAVIAARKDDENRAWTTGFPNDWLHDGDDLRVGTHTLRVLHTPGHTRGHVVFRDEVRDLLFAGDHILPHITPSIGFEAALVPLPLGDYLRSLHLVREMPDTRLLPAHGPVADSAHRRIDELLFHHDKRLAAAARSVAEGATTAHEVAKRLTWTRRERHFGELDPFNQMLAVLEMGAHLDLLVVQDRLARETIDDVALYKVN